MLGVLADDHNFALALDDLALLTHRLNGRSDFHLNASLLLASPGNTAACQVVGRHLNSNLIAGENSDKIHPEFAGYMCQDNMPVSDVYLKHRVGQGLYNRSLEFNYIVFSQSDLTSKTVLQISSAIVSISGSPSVMQMVFS